jgi:uncharacterized protein YjiS (DUF1127 family)
MAFTEYSSKPTILIPGLSDLFRGFRKFAKRQQKRREIAKLLNQEDWVLMDMGISRGDVREALAFRGDASLHLRALAARRRYWSRQYNQS